MGPSVTSASSSFSSDVQYAGRDQTFSICLFECFASDRRIVLHDYFDYVGGTSQPCDTCDG